MSITSYNYSTSTLAVSADGADMDAHTSIDAPRPVLAPTGVLPSALFENRTATTSALPQAIAANWGSVARARMTQHMYGRLLRLAATRSSALTEKSLADFFDFWTRVRNVSAEPELALAPDGTLSAEWFKSQRQRLDVQFAGRKVIFGLFANNGILEGAEALRTVAELLKNHPSKPLQWKVD